MATDEKAALSLAVGFLSGTRWGVNLITSGPAITMAALAVRKESIFELELIEIQGAFVKEESDCSKSNRAKAKMQLLETYSVKSTQPKGKQS